jgi:hypothetical protein
MTNEINPINDTYQKFIDKDYVMLTNIVNLQYYGEVIIGSSNKNYKLLFDTGSC